MSTTFQPPLSASLARRLAEAADGIRNIDNVFFVAGYKPPHPIKHFPDEESAQSYLSYLFDLGFTDKDFAKFGPFKTTDELEPLNLIGVESIESVDLAIHYKDGRTQNVYLPGGIDSIFLNLSSFEKFVFPYYCHLFGVEYAKILRDNLLAEYTEYAKSNTDKTTMLLPPPKHPHAYVTLMVKLNKYEEFPDAKSE